MPCDYCGSRLEVRGMKHCFLCRFPDSILPKLVYAKNVGEDVSESLGKSHREFREMNAIRFFEGAWAGGQLSKELVEIRIRTEFRFAVPVSIRRANNLARKIHPRIVHGRQHYRGENWEEQRSKALKRDGYRCQLCGLSNQEHRERDDMYPPNAGLHVHHIIPFRECDDADSANRLENLISLCYRCHRLTELENHPELTIKD